MSLTPLKWLHAQRPKAGSTESVDGICWQERAANQGCSAPLLKVTAGLAAHTKAPEDHSPEKVSFSSGESGPHSQGADMYLRMHL